MSASEFSGSAIDGLTLEEQVAQLFMVGFAGHAPGDITRRFLELGVGGLIFFRDNFEGMPDAAAVHGLLAGLGDSVPAHLPRPLMGIDQEGGQVERLPHTLFPTMLTPGAVTLSPNPEALAREMYALMAWHLRALGFNLDFFPTLDVNLNPQNPIIGVRSFGDDPETVWRLASIALTEFEKKGLIAVGKHFPGHGNGTVDSHLDLPTLHFTEAELLPFRQAVAAGLPVMLVAHGYYPALQTTNFEKSLPSSASPVIIQGLLRDKLGFDGVVITDDMCMGAITRHRGPVEAALASLRAGVDILLYKQSTADEWAVYEAVLQAFRSGNLPMDNLHRSLARITRLKAKLAQQPAPGFRPADFSPARCRELADTLAHQGIGMLSGRPDLLPLDPAQPLLLVHPDRRKMGNYAFDVTTSEELETMFRHRGFSDAHGIAYPAPGAFDVQSLLAQARVAMTDAFNPIEDEPGFANAERAPYPANPPQTRISRDKASSISSSQLASAPQAICMISFNARLHECQVALYEGLRAAWPGVPLILVSAGYPETDETLPEPDLHLSLCSYRPASMRALADFLGGSASARPQAAMRPGFLKPHS